MLSGEQSRTQISHLSASWRKQGRCATNAEVIQMYVPAILLVKRKKEKEDEDFKEEEWEDDEDEEWEDDDSDDMDDEEE